MGVFNSSITRVWPVFEFLLHRDALGTEWFPKLLRLANASTCIGDSSAHAPGPLLPHVSRSERKLPDDWRKELEVSSSERLGRIRNAFEARVPPSEAFLRWLLEHPAQMTRPRGEKTREERRRMARTALHVWDDNKKYTQIDTFYAFQCALFKKKYIFNRCECRRFKCVQRWRFGAS